MLGLDVSEILGENLPLSLIFCNIAHAVVMWIIRAKCPVK